jgi:hypothetical protein
MLRSNSCARLLALCLLAAAVPVAFPAEDGAKPAADDGAARELVSQALKAEAAGDNDRRGELLYRAWLAAPQLPEANWHTARVQSEGEWLPLAQAAARAAANPDRVKYEELRERATNAKALRDLARWCQKHDMPDRSRLHYAQLLVNAALDGQTSREALEALELEQVGGMWFTREEVVARRKQLDEARAALEQWLPVLRKLQPLIDGDDFKRRDEAIEQLHALKEPSLIVALEAMLPIGGPRFQEEAIQRLTKFREYEATLSLVKYAVLSPHSLARRAATAALKVRPLHEYVPVLLGGLKSPLKSQFQVRWDARGRLIYDQAVLQEGTTSNLLLLAHHMSIPNVSNQLRTTSDVKTVPRTERAELTVKTTAAGVNRLEAFAAERQAVVNRALNEQAAVQLANNQVEAENQRIYEILEAATGAQQQRSTVDWWNWWQDYNQYSWPKPTYAYHQWSARAYTAQLYVHQHISGTRWPGIGGSCFLAGTSVRTETGPRPIESIKPGDRVLTQDPDSGELTQKLVLKTTLRPPAKMLRLTLGDDQLVTTWGHPFWVEGHGWKMAKELVPGDSIHTLGGAVKLEKTLPAADAQAHNLVVDDFNTYFVGMQGLLVHDNEFRRPTRAVVPGLVLEAD